MEYSVINNSDRQQFEIREEGETAYLQYRSYPEIIWLMHTEVPARFEGKGMGSALAQFALEWARANHTKVKVVCPFVAVYIKRHPEYQDIIQP